MSHAQGLPTEQEIERIVRDVLARMQATGNAETEVAQKNEELRSDATRLELQDRVISVATLAGRLAKGRAIVVPAKSIVTPAARDLLRERGIAIHRQAGRAPAAQLGLRRVVGVAETKFEPTSLLAGLRDNEIQQVARVGLVGVVDEIVDSVVRGGAIGLLFTETADAALCLANRTPGVRAVLARSANLVRQARTTLAANLFVVEATGKSLFELRQIVVATTTPAGHSLEELVRQRLA